MRNHLVSLSSTDELKPEYLERMQTGDYLLLEWNERILIKRWSEQWFIYDVSRHPSASIQWLTDNIRDNSEIAICNTVEQARTAIMDDWILK